MKNYYRLMLGPKSIYAEECLTGSFIGGDFGIDQDLSNDLPDRWQQFNEKFRDVWLKSHPTKNKISAGLACGSLWVISKGINVGDVVLCPDGNGAYCVGEVTGTYNYVPGQILPHRRTVHWFSHRIRREEMSPALRNSTGSIGTVARIDKHVEELERLICGEPVPRLIHTDERIEDPIVFALEKHLEDFLVANWSSTELGQKYDIFEEDGELVGQQYPSDTGPIDILAISKDKQELLVVELKKGRASDNVVGQIQRYMGYVIEALAEPNQKVRGIIIALDDDLRIRRALMVNTSIDFYRYQISFKLLPHN